MDTARKKPKKIYHEEVKTRHTPHWDWDYLTTTRIEDHLRQAGVGAARTAGNRGASRSKRRAGFRLAATGLILLLPAAAWALLARP